MFYWRNFWKTYCTETWLQVYRKKYFVKKKIPLYLNKVHTIQILVFTLLYIFMHYIHRVHRGFTLIEIVTVVSIISILMAALFPVMNHYIVRARDATRQSDISNIVLWLGSYYVDNSTFPHHESGCFPAMALSWQYIHHTYLSPSGSWYNEWCWENWLYGYSVRNLLYLVPSYVIMARMENQVAWNYSGSTEGFTGDLVQIALSNIQTYTQKWAWHIYVMSSPTDTSNSAWSTVEPPPLIPIVNWGWSDWGTCSATCWGWTQSRSCNNPSPSGGGTNCIWAGVQACNTQQCACVIGSSYIDACIIQ